MEFKELKIKSERELENILKKAKQDLQAARFKIAAKQMKDVREIRVLKKLIAHVLTLKSQSKQKKEITKK